MEGIPLPLPVAKAVPPQSSNDQPPEISPSQEGEESEFAGKRRRSWARLITKTWLCDPKRCPACGKRIDVSRASEMADDFLKRGIVTTDIAVHSAQIFQTAVDLGRTTYDAAYVVLAERTGLDLITGDRRLFNAVHNQKPFVRYIGDREQKASGDESGR